MDAAQQTSTHASTSSAVGCPGTALTAELGRQWQDPPGQFHLDAVIKSDETCSLQGYASVTLIGRLEGEPSEYPLPDSSEQAEPVHLAPDENAHIEVTFLPYEPGSLGAAFYATSIRIRPPAESPEDIELAWTSGEVSYQAGATHPGTYVGPLTTAAP